MIYDNKNKEPLELSGEVQNDALRKIYEGRGEKTLESTHSYTINDTRINAEKPQSDAWDAFTNQPEATEKWRLDELNNIEDMLKSHAITPEKAEQYRQEVNNRSEQARQAVLRQAAESAGGQVSQGESSESGESNSQEAEMEALAQKQAELMQEIKELKEKIAEMSQAIQANKAEPAQDATLQTVEFPPATPILELPPEAVGTIMEKSKHKNSFRKAIRRAAFTVFCLNDRPYYFLFT